MTPANLAKYVRKQTRTDASTLPDDILLIYANIAKNEICEKIAKTDEDYFGLDLTRNLEAGKRKYGLDASVMNGIKYVEAKIDGITQKRLVPYNLNKLGITTDEAGITSFMSGKSWGYFIFGAQFYLLSSDPIINVTGGLVMWANVYPKDLTDLTSEVDMTEVESETEFGVPLLVHELIARRTIIEYKNSQEKPIALTEKEQSFYSDLKEKISLLTSFNLDEEIVPSVPHNDGSNY